MCTPDEAPPMSPKRRALCSRENALRVAGRIFDAGQHAYVIRTGDPLQPFRATATPSIRDEVETLLCA